MDRHQESSSFKPPVIRLFQWNSENNTALLAIRANGLSKLVELDLNNLDFKIITDKKVKWAQKSEDGRFIYIDHLNRFWKPGPAEDQLIESLEVQGTSKRFVIKDNRIYGVNKENRLWLYDLNIDTFKILRVLHEDVDYLTDINQTHFLVELVVSAKEVVVELVLSE